MNTFSESVGGGIRLKPGDPLLHFIKERAPKLLEDTNIPLEDYLAVVAEGFIELLEPPDEPEIKNLWRICARLAREQVRKGNLRILATAPVEKVEAAAWAVCKNFDQDMERWDEQFSQEHGLPEKCAEYEKGIALYDNQEYKKAVEVFSKLTEWNPDAQVWLARCLLQMGDLEGACREADDVLSRTQDKPDKVSILKVNGVEVHYRGGDKVSLQELPWVVDVYYKAGRVEDVIEHIKEYCEEVVKHYREWQFLDFVLRCQQIGEVKDSIGRLSETVETLKRSRDFDNDQELKLTAYSLREAEKVIGG